MKKPFYLFFLLNFMIPLTWGNTPTLNQVSGMVSPHSDVRFVRIPNKYTDKTEYIQKNVMGDLERMILAAQKDGVRLRVISGFRSFTHQKNIWQRKWHTYSGDEQTRVKHILRYSTPPAFSRHHWGSDVDLNSLKLAYWSSAEGRKTFDWLKKNAKKFGFCQVYSANRGKGHTQEMWHWSHIRSARAYYRIRISTLTQAKHLPISGNRVLTPELLRPYVSSIQTCGL